MTVLEYSTATPKRTQFHRVSQMETPFVTFLGWTREETMRPPKDLMRVFKARLAPLGYKLEIGPSEEGGGVFIEIPLLKLTDYGRTMEDAIGNLVEKAYEIASERRTEGEGWTVGLAAQVYTLRRILA